MEIINVSLKDNSVTSEIVYNTTVYRKCQNNFLKFTKKFSREFNP